MTPLLWVIVGPNGAGKSTYHRTRVLPHFNAPFINADIIAKEKWPGDTAARSYDAARLAAERRQQLLRAKRSFAAETVFSHPSKLDLIQKAQDAGYEVWTTFVMLEKDELAVRRVAERTQRGGHPVPPEKIRTRYARLLPLVAKALKLSDKGYLVDNTSPTRPLRDVAGMERGKRVWTAKGLPGWLERFMELLAEHEQ